MWTRTDNGMLINLNAVRSVTIEVSDDRQWVEVQVRWASGGERASITSLVVQDYGDVKPAQDAAEVYLQALMAKLQETGELLELPSILPPKEPIVNLMDAEHDTNPKPVDSPPDDPNAEIYF